MVQQQLSYSSVAGPDTLLVTKGPFMTHTPARSSRNQHVDGLVRTRLLAFQASAVSVCPVKRRGTDSVFPAVRMASQN